MAKKTRNPNKPDSMSDDELFIEYGTPEHEALLSAGYGGMTREDAERIIAERDANPLTHPYEEYRRAKAFLAGLEAVPVVIDKKPGWKREARPVR
jgi:hypothetical protein